MAESNSAGEPAFFSFSFSFFSRSYFPRACSAAEADSAGKSAEAQAEAVLHLQHAQLREVLAKVDAGKVKSVKGHIDKAGTWFDKALGVAKVRGGAWMVLLGDWVAK